VHGSFGFSYLEAWAPWLEERPDVRASLGRYLRRAFAHAEKARSGLGLPRRVLSTDEIALGIPDPARLPEVFYSTIEGAVLPGLARFDLGAELAWRERSLG
jgi:hypothetical protein